MRVVIAPDSFKECAAADEVANAAAEGVRRAAPHAEIDCAPMADGGEGTVAAIAAATGATKVTIEATGPLGAPLSASYGLFPDGKTVVIEMAAVAGLPLVPQSDRDPRITSTYGLGELIRDALERGVRKVVIGLGGSATNDAGAGMAQALGFSLQDAEGKELPRGGAALKSLHTIDSANKHGRIDDVHFTALSDVMNPMCGPDGASAVYGPQKGATPEAVEELDAALAQFTDVAEVQLGCNIAVRPGSGAAGGLGGGVVAFLGGEIRPGAEAVSELIGLEARIAGADLVITGEGALDAQTASGKAPRRVIDLANRHNTPVIALAGALRPGYESLFALGLTAAFSIVPRPLNLEEAVQNAPTFIADAAENAVRLWLARRDANGPGLDS